MDFKEHIIEKIVDITGLEREVVEKSVEVPPDEKMGDIAFPCFPLAKVMRKAQSCPYPYPTCPNPRLRQVRKKQFPK